MAIYLCFIQHILYSLKEGGKAAIVVPTGFLTAKAGIEYNIRKEIIDNQWLRGVISMPSNIFANTGTNVSVLFIDKTNKDGKTLLIDASNMGSKVKVGKYQKTQLSNDEMDKIVNTFIKNDILQDFSILVNYQEIKNKNYSFSAGQYFEVKVEYIDINQNEYEKMIDDFYIDYNKHVEETIKFQEEIIKTLKELKLK